MFFILHSHQDTQTHLKLGTVSAIIKTFIACFFPFPSKYQEECLGQMMHFLFFVTHNFDYTVTMQDLYFRLSVINDGRLWSSLHYWFLSMTHCYVMSFVLWLLLLLHMYFYHKHIFIMLLNVYGTCTQLTLLCIV